MLQFTEQVRSDLKFMDYVPVHFISALTKQRVNKIIPEALRVVEARRHRLSTSEVNQMIRAAYDKVTPPTRGGRALRLYFGTQVETEPPTFIIFVNKSEGIHFSYERYLMNCLRQAFGFIACPIRLKFSDRK